MVQKDQYLQILEEKPMQTSKMDEENDCQGYNSSFVEERSRIFHEDIPVPGTNITLHYASNRVEVYRYGITSSGEWRNRSGRP